MPIFSDANWLSEILARRNRSLCVLFFVEDGDAINDLAEVTREFDQRATREQVKLDIVFPIRRVPTDDPLARLWEKYNPSGESTLAVFINGQGETLARADRAAINVEELIGLVHSALQSKGQK